MRRWVSLWFGLLVCLWATLSLAAGNTVGPRACQMQFVQSIPASQEATPTGWHIYLRQSGSYGTAIKSPSVSITTSSKQTTVTIDCRGFALADGQWYAIVRAYNSNGESDPSNEAAFVWNNNQADPTLQPPTGGWIGP